MTREATAILARSITRAGSKQTYYTALLMVDKELLSDFFRAYAYFRWADDIIDRSNRSTSERISFIKHQRALIDRLYNNECPNDLNPEEEIIADLIHHDGEINSGLRSFINNMFAVIEFDAYRMGRIVSNSELIWYSSCLAQSVTDGLQYFIGNNSPNPPGDNRYLAAIAAHYTHLLRDMICDIADGFINIPQEYLDEHGIGPEDVNSPAFRAWVRKRVEQARAYFRDGKRYLDSLEVLRCKIMGYWYCARFEGILDTIERDGYILRANYKYQFVWFRMLGLGVILTFQHIFSRAYATLGKNFGKLT
jgi:phytoene/squalene synthetase